MSLGVDIAGALAPHVITLIGEFAGREPSEEEVRERLRTMLGDRPDPKAPDNREELERIAGEGGDE
jgi:hypothetical protein